MKRLFVVLALLFTSHAFAITSSELERTCLETGKTKIALQAEAWDCEVDVSKVYASEVDNRWYNPSKYVWYTHKGECLDYDQLTVLVQYYRGKCF